MKDNITLVVIAVGILILAGTFSCQGERVMEKKSQTRELVDVWKTLKKETHRILLP